MRQNKCCYQLVDELPLTQGLPCPVSPFVRASDSLCCIGCILCLREYARAIDRAYWKSRLL